jgi:protein kinase C-binding protein NELL
MHKHFGLHQHAGMVSRASFKTAHNHVNCLLCFFRYYCKCKAGYEMRDNNCVDIDECQDMTHSCHPSSTCVNTDGHFECKCRNLHSMASSLNTLKSREVPSVGCKLSCMFEDKEIADQGQIRPRNQPCTLCTCSKGVITCAEPPCDCSRWRRAEDRELCCPQCDPKESCQHQELKHVTFKSGEQWIYQCQTCECLVSCCV